MSYLFISHILEAIEGNNYSFKHLQGIEFLRDSNGKIKMLSGNSAVVFRVRYIDSDYALRCYHIKRDRLRSIYGNRLFANELELRLKYNNTLLDVVLCDWVEGENLAMTLSKVRRFGLHKRRKEFEELSRGFDRMACYLLSQEWAHGDLSDTNIIVRRDEVTNEVEMRVIDMDTIYTPALEGSLALDLGTPSFQSAYRTEKLYCKSMDHFSIALLSCALRALSIDPSLMDIYPDEDAVLINGARILEPRYEVIEALISLLKEKGCAAHYLMAQSVSRGELEIEMLPLWLQHTVHHNESKDMELYNSGELWGYKDSNSGEVVIPPLFTEGREFKGSWAKVSIGGYWRTIDRSGRVID